MEESSFICSHGLLCLSGLMILAMMMMNSGDMVKRSIGNWRRFVYMRYFAVAEDGTLSL